MHCFRDENTNLLGGAQSKSHLPLLCGIKSNLKSRQVSYALDLDTMNQAKWSSDLKDLLQSGDATSVGNVHEM